MFLTGDQWEEIADLSFHDLRHDFAHRARDAGWSLEEVAYYLGHVTKKGTPAIQTTVRRRPFLCDVPKVVGHFFERPEVAYYLGHVTKKGTPAIQTTVRYTQVSREQVKEKLKY